MQQKDTSMKKVTFYYVRHGRTEYNKRGIIQGQVDSPLCKESLSVLYDTRDVLQEIPISRCFSSPFQRALNTAKIVLGDHDVQIIPLDDLKEMSFGRLDGKPHKDHWKALFIMHALDSFRPVGGESCRDMKKRAKRAIESIYNACEDGDHVLIAGHGSWCRYMLFTLFHTNRYTLKLSKEYHGAANGSITAFTCTDGKYELICYPLSAEEFRKRILTENESVIP